MPSGKEEREQCQPIGWAGRRVAVVGVGRAIDEVLCDGLGKGGAQVRLVTCADGPAAGERDLFSVDELRDCVRGCDAVFCTIGINCFESGDGARHWAMSVGGVGALCLAMEAEGVGRLSFLSSVVCLGRQTTASAVGIGTPYLSDDNREGWEKSLFRGEMEAWKAAERGIAVSVVCAGWIEEDLRGPVERFASGGGKYVAPMSSGFTNAEEVARAMMGAAEGERVMCVGRNARLVDVANEVCPGSQFREVRMGVAKLLARLPKSLGGRWMFAGELGRGGCRKDEYECGGAGFAAKP